MEFLEACLRHKSEIVIYEAARALVNLPNVTGREIAPAISVLQLFLSSPKPTLRFAAVKTLNKVSSTQLDRIQIDIPCLNLIYIHDYLLQFFITHLTHTICRLRLPTPRLLQCVT